MSDIMREFLVGLGFKVEGKGLKEFTHVIDGTTKAVTNMAKIAGLSAVALEGSVAVMAGRLSDLYYVSQRTGSTVNNISALRLAARQVGLSADQGASSLENFANAMRNPGLKAYVHGMGVETEGRQNVEIMRDFVGVLGQLPELYGMQVAQMFGISGDAFLNMKNNLGEYDKGIKSHLDILQKYHVSENEAATDSVEFSRQLHNVEDRFVVMGERIGIAFMPYADHFLKWLADSADKLIAFEEKHHFFERALDVIAGGVKKVGDEIENAFGDITEERVEHWLDVLTKGLGIAVDLADKLRQSKLFGGDGHEPQPPASSEDWRKGQQIPTNEGAYRRMGHVVDYLTTHYGFISQPMAIGIAANAERESTTGTNPQAYKRGASHWGLFQLDRERQARFNNWNLEHHQRDQWNATLEDELDFMAAEMSENPANPFGAGERGSNKARRMMAEENDPYKNAVIFGQMAERYGDKPDEDTKRGELAQGYRNYWDKIEINVMTQPGADKYDIGKAARDGVTDAILSSAIRQNQAHTQ